jgi:hypothetical protein
MPDVSSTADFGGRTVAVESGSSIEALGPVIIWIAPAPDRQGMQRKAQAAGRGGAPAKDCNAAMRPLPVRPFG